MSNLIKSNTELEIGELNNVIYRKTKPLSNCCCFMKLGFFQKVYRKHKNCVRVRAWYPQTVKNDEAGMLHVIHYEKWVYYSTELQIYFWWNGSCFPRCHNMFCQGICFWNLVRGYLALTSTPHLSLLCS